MVLASSNVQWGDAATWVGSIGTALAFFATLILLLITRQEQKVAREDDRRAQARQVSAWCVHVEPADPVGLHMVTVKVWNSSDEPVYGMRVAVGAEWSGQNISVADVPGLRYVTPPKYREDHKVRIKLSPLPGKNYEDSPPVELVFNDASGGRFWRRDRYGGLTQLTERTPSGAAKHLFTKPANPL